MSEQSKKSAFEYIAKNANVGPREIFKHEMEPYLEIAILNKLVKEKPDDEDDMVWIDKRNGSEQRLVLTRKGFISALQYNLHEKIQEQGKNISQLNNAVFNAKKRETELADALRIAEEKIITSDMIVGKTTRKTICNIIDSSLTDAVKFEEIKNILKKK